MGQETRKTFFSNVSLLQNFGRSSIKPKTSFHSAKSDTDREFKFGPKAKRENNLKRTEVIKRIK